MKLRGKFGVIRKTLRRMFDWVRMTAYVWASDQEKIVENEYSKYRDLGVNYVQGQKKLEETLNKTIDPLETSSHMIFFSALSAATTNISSILEIGTFRGETTNLLSKLFPTGHITTIDLPVSDPIYRNSYLGARGNATRQEAYNKTLTQNLSPNNVSFIETNSFFLLSFLDRKFDLIWLDGGHFYPEIAWDACQAYWLCRPGGMIIFDDVLLDPKARTTDKLSRAVFEVVTYIVNRTDCKVTYLLKRLNPKYHAVPRLRKHIAVLEKTLEPDFSLS